MSGRDDIVTENGLCPLIALLTSDAVEAAAQKNALTFADLLSPFCTAQVSLKDPAGQQVNSRLRLDVRNIQQSGFLLSLTVLPSVLHEAVGSASYAKEDDDAWSVAFRDSFMYWLEPPECDFLRTYVCCMFAVSADEPDPLAELGRLTQLQHLQQHGSGTTTTSFGPAHCAEPKWFLPNILKYYVVVQDVSQGNDQKASDLHSQLCATHGAQFCHLLKINSTSRSDLPDPWARILEHRYRGLHSGLDLARRHLISNAPETDISNLSIRSPNATHPPSSTGVFTMSTPVPLSYSTSSSTNGYEKPQTALPNGTVSAGAPPTSANQPGVAHGQALDVGDRDRLKALVEDFMKKALVPFAERQVQAQNETLTNRRGIGKSFTNVRKWFGGASASPTSTSQITYGQESSELQVRRLADLAFLFGMHSFAHQLYQSVKKDFANDQSWLYHAAALEMAALTSFLGAEATSPKRYPQHYMENALNYYLNTCGQPLLALRCAMLSSAILSRMEMFTDAGNQLVRLTGHLPELYNAVISEHAGNTYGKARMRRRMALNLVLAGHRYSKAEQLKLAMRCYEKALPEYYEKGWWFAEGHCLNVLARHSDHQQTAAECSEKLLRPFSAQSPELLSTFLAQYVSTARAASAEPVKFVLPLIDCSAVRVIRGEHPRTFAAAVDAISSVSQTDEEQSAVGWSDIEQAAYRALNDNRPFKPLVLSSDASTENAELHPTAPHERFRVELTLQNPLSVPLLLRHLRISVKQADSDGALFWPVSSVEEVELPARSLDTNEAGSPVSIELSVTPPDHSAPFVVDKLLFEVVSPGSNATLHAYLPLEIPGRRLFATKHQRTKKTYAVDKRLHARVSKSAWPLLDFKFSGNASQQSHVNAFCSQLYQILLDVENTGTTAVKALAMAADRPDLVSLSECDANSQASWRLCDSSLASGGPDILVHTVRIDDQLPPGGKLSLRLSLRAPSAPVNNFPISMVFYYIDTNRCVRHFNYRLRLSTQTLLHSEAKVLDSADGLCALQLRNVLSSRDSALAKVELLRLSAVVQAQADTTPPSVAIQPVRKRQVSVECEQTEVCCFYLATAESDTSATLWVNESTVDVPKWAHLVDVAKLGASINLAEYEEQPPLLLAQLRLAVLWKATIANTGGTVGTILGEELLPNPFADPANTRKPMRLPGVASNWAFVLTDKERADVEQHVTRSRSDAKFQIPWAVPQDAGLDDDRTVGECSSAIRCRLLRQVEPILHDFSSNRICRFRVRLEVTNYDLLHRNCTVVVNTAQQDYLPTSVGNSTRPTSSLSITSPPHGGLFANLSVSRQTLTFGSTEVFTISFCTLNPGVYDVGSCIEAFAVLEGSDSQTRLSLPACTVSAKDCSRNL